MSALGTWLVSLAGPAIRKILLSLGIGVASYAAVATALASALGAAQSAWGGFGGDSLAILQLSGIGEAMGIIAGAMTARLTLMAVKKLEILT